VNSFGFSGTNAHAILTEAPKRVFLESEPSSHYLLPLSAFHKTPKALSDMVKDLHEYLVNTEDNLDGIE
jgi:acyl transferase domain-containing protein